MRVYISPSTQEKNIGVVNFGTEEYQMNKIADFVIPHLIYLAFEVKRNDPEKSLYDAINESNDWGSELHIAIHSNAGPQEAQGTEVWYHPASAKGKELAQAIYSYLAPLSPGKDRGLKSSEQFAELRLTKAPAIILEIAFHTNYEDAKWMIDNPKQIAEAIVKGVCYYTGKPYRSQSTIAEEERNVLMAENNRLKGIIKRIYGITKEEAGP